MSSIRVEWIKLHLDISDNKKMKYIRTLDNGNDIVLFWVMLLIEAGKCNAGGKIYLTENLPYTPKMLASELDFDEKIVLIALEVFQKLEMISIINEIITITNWEVYQNIEGLEKIRQQGRDRQKRYYYAHKEQPNVMSNVMPNVSITQPNATEEDIEEDIEEDKEIDKDIKDRIDYQQIVDMYNSICISYPQVKTLSDARKKAIKARLKTYSLDDFKMLFEKAEASSFLKGGNDNNWCATFDWLLKDANMAKVLDGNYDDKGKKEVSKQKTKNPFNEYEQHSKQEAISYIEQLERQANERCGIGVGQNADDE